MIKRYHITFILLATISFTILSCKKDANQSEIDSGLIEAYVLDNDLNGQFSPSGLYYEILAPGSSQHPNIYSKVNASYKGTLLNGEVFDEGKFISFDLIGVIQGWQEGLQLIGEGGKILLVIPSGMAYGQNGSQDIGSNEILAFDVTLHYFTN